MQRTVRKHRPRKLGAKTRFQCSPLNSITKQKTNSRAPELSMANKDCAPADKQLQYLIEKVKFGCALETLLPRSVMNQPKTKRYTSHQDKLLGGSGTRRKVP
eukprot:1749289-Amphidinium_carterae.6